MLEAQIAQLEQQLAVARAELARFGESVVLRSRWLSRERRGSHRVPQRLEGSKVGIQSCYSWSAYLRRHDRHTQSTSQVAVRHGHQNRAFGPGYNSPGAPVNRFAYKTYSFVTCGGFVCEPLSKCEC